MSCPDNRSQIVRVLYSIEDYEQPSVGQERVQFSVPGDGAIGNNALVVHPFGFSIQETSWFEPNGYGTFPAQRYDFLNARSARSLSDYNLIQRPSGAQSFANGMDAERQTHAQL